MAMKIPDYQIDVTVRSEFAAEHSDPAHDRYLFIYYISICNNGLQAAQLISRHWLISDATGRVDEVRGEGVVGEQPIIQPGKEHCYNSFCVLESPVGCMQGSYQLLADDGHRFDASVAAFTLAIPGSLN
ncbi:MAG: Co2+/Mg2+ efflux protein ApaG [Mariprofundus sp.]|nr:Co2+/Mg2+ efflux protein ApaG [Mariprofundus sp.]